ncbi:MAG: hypothetical protein ABIP35_05195 [Ginsengibacter sp.]
MKQKFVILLIALVFILGCQSEKDNPDRKYQVKSGVITYDTQLKTISVNLSYITIVYFDDYGSKERRDTYEDGQLKESFICNGISLYQVSHQKKTAWKTGVAIHGTEPRFSIANLPKEDIKSGKIVMMPGELIAGKDCEIYRVNTGVATATYGGWKNISMLSEVKSPGGTSLMKAVNIETIPVDDVKFRLPTNYILK